MSGGFRGNPSASEKLSYIWATSMFCLHGEALSKMGNITCRTHHSPSRLLLPFQFPTCHCWCAGGVRKKPSPNRYGGTVRPRWYLMRLNTCVVWQTTNNTHLTSWFITTYKQVQTLWLWPSKSTSLAFNCKSLTGQMQRCCFSHPICC